MYDFWKRSGTDLSCTLSTFTLWGFFVHAKFCTWNYRSYEETCGRHELKYMTSGNGLELIYRVLYRHFFASWWFFVCAKLYRPTINYRSFERSVRCWKCNVLLLGTVWSWFILYFIKLFFKGIFRPVVNSEHGIIGILRDWLGVKNLLHVDRKGLDYYFLLLLFLFFLFLDT